MKRKNMISMVTSLALVGVVAVGGTLALLTRTSNEVNNTFTVGAGYEAKDILLTEAGVKQVTNGDYVAVDQVTSRDDEVMIGEEGAETSFQIEEGQYRYESNSYDKLIGGTTIYKDPRVSIEPGTIPSWVVVRIDNVDDAFEGSKFTSSDWYKVNESEGTYTLGAVINDTDITAGYYIYQGVVETSQNWTHLPALFTSLDVADGVTSANAIGNMNLKAGLIQYAGDGTAESKSVTTDGFDIQTIMTEVVGQLTIDG